MKLLLLLIYNSTPHYDKLLEQQQKYIHTHKDIDSYFISLREDNKEDIEIENDIVYVKGTESYMNITYKTIASMDYFINKLNKKYDFVIRSNMSTFLNLKQLYNNILKLPKNNVYTGGHLHNLQWIDKKYGIYDKRYFGLNFVCGLCIILSCDIVKNIIKNIDKINMNIIDDVTICLYIRDFHKIAYINQHKYKQSFIGFNPPIDYYKLSIDKMLKYTLIRTVKAKNISQYGLLYELQEAYNSKQ